MHSSSSTKAAEDMMLKLVDELGIRTVMVLTNAIDEATVLFWCNFAQENPSERQQKQIAYAHELYSQVKAAQGDFAAQMWFYKADANFGNHCVAFAIKDEKYEQARKSATDFINEGSEKQK